jgi:hypothetical protein
MSVGSQMPHTPHTPQMRGMPDMPGLSDRRAAAITTPFWDALLTGGLSIVCMGAVLVWTFRLGPPAVIAQGDWIALSILINSAHFMASYRLLYVSRAEILAHRWSTLYVPAALLATLLVASVLPARDGVFELLTVASAVYLAWHYTGQAWGMVASFGHASGIRWTARERGAIRFGMRVLLVQHAAYALASQLPAETWSRIYRTTFFWVCAVAVVSFMVGAVAYSAAHRRTGRVPVRAVIPWLALFVWYPFWYFVPNGLLFVQLAHALQYLAFPLRVEVNRYAEQGLAEQTPRTASQKRLRALVVYAGLVVAGGTILYGPQLAVRVFGDGWYSTRDVDAIFVAFSNCIAIHHYFIDGAVWKLSNPQVRRELFSHLGER